jgi:hypothetical protein
MTAASGLVRALVAPRAFLEQPRPPLHIGEEKGDLALGQVDAAGHDAAIVADLGPQPLSAAASTGSRPARKSAIVTLTLLSGLTASRLSPEPLPKSQ